jgi:hypothetical protein
MSLTAGLPCGVFGRHFQARSGTIAGMEEKALLTSDATIREAVENPSAFLMKMIGSLYDRPQMYVRRLGELNALLYFTHFLWANVAGQTSH